MTTTSKNNVIVYYQISFSTDHEKYQEQQSCSEKSFDLAIERACKIVDKFANKKLGEKINIKITEQFIGSLKLPRLKFTEEIPLTKEKMSSKLFKLRRKIRQENNNSMLNTEKTE